ncbi:MAG: hypothetical protein H7Z74_13460 [Anaerolineae bacterium]|nr:hypothetical protein [Gemmatimonadaceae bacterium]
MRKLAIIPLVLMVFLGCPKGDSDEIDTVAVDTTPVDLDSLVTVLPPPAPDTFTPPKLPTASPNTAASIPNAPPALMEAVEREQSFTKFCYQEFGLKADPSLRGGVAMIVTVGSGGITKAVVGNDNWTGRAGKAVNTCLNQKAAQAWQLAAGAVKPGRYVVPLSFGTA